MSGAGLLVWTGTDVVGPGSGSTQPLPGWQYSARAAVGPNAMVTLAAANAIFDKRIPLSP
jgi:hypothetical protein